MIVTDIDLRMINHDMEIEAYFCDWQREWIAYDKNNDPNDGGLAASGRTRGEAIAELIGAWEYHRLQK